MYHWPGNVRELEHVLERAANSVLSGYLKIEHFNFMRIFQADNQDRDNQTLSLEGIRTKAEREAIIKAVVEAGGNKTLASVILKIDRSVLYDKIRKYKISM